jgi:hypothetical protein
MLFYAIIINSAMKYLNILKKILREKLDYGYRFNPI